MQQWHSGKKNYSTVRSGIEVELEHDHGLICLDKFAV